MLNGVRQRKWLFSWCFATIGLSLAHLPLWLCVVSYRILLFDLSPDFVTRFFGNVLNLTQIEDTPTLVSWVAFSVGEFVAILFGLVFGLVFGVICERQQSSC